jgi:nucleotide-binding universal stress UspA family protein
MDGSEQSFHATNYAVAIAQRYDAELYALHVTSSPTLYNVSSKMPEDQIPDEVRKFRMPRNILSLGLTRLVKV